MSIKPIRLFQKWVNRGISDESRNARAEFEMIFAGPASSVIAALILLLMSYTVSRAAAPRPVFGVMECLAYLNFVMAGFNLLPAFPPDGRRTLRSILWRWKDNLRRAAGIASRIGEVLGLMLIFTGIFDIFAGNLIEGIWWSLIGISVQNAFQISVSADSHRILRHRQWITAKRPK